MNALVKSIVMLAGLTCMATGAMAGNTAENTIIGRSIESDPIDS